MKGTQYFEEYVSHIIQLYDEWINKEEKRGISYGEIHHISNLSQQELEEMETELYDELEEIPLF